MILSEDRQTHIAHVIVDGIWNDDLVEYTNEDEAIRCAKRAVADYVGRESSLDEAVRSKISSQKKLILEGTREFDLLYKKYYEEETRRRGG
ncbi:MAG: DUF507 family protein [Oligoflexia bacterium]|nr:DUF507 family protein [Oligoflexia bacterium]